MNPGDRILLTVPREPSREGEYIETRGARCRVLLDGETETRVVLRERVKPVPPRAPVREKAYLPPDCYPDGSEQQQRAIAWHDARNAERMLHIALHAEAFPPTPAEQEAARASIAEHMSHFEAPEAPIQRTQVSLSPLATAVRRGKAWTSVATAHDALRAAAPHPALKAVPKPPKPDRNPQYLAWIRQRHCCVCHRDATEAHHYGPRGMGQKCSDYLTVPLCTACHREFHDTGHCRWSTAEETRETFLQTQVTCLSLWAEERLRSDTNEVIVNALIAHIREAKG